VDAEEYSVHKMIAHVTESIALDVTCDTAKQYHMQYIQLRSAM
jgi:hypothetical protein